MEKFWQFIKAFFIVLSLFAMFFLALRYEFYASLFGLPFWMIPFLGFLLILYVGYSFVDLYLNKNEVEQEFTTIVNHTFRTPLTRISWITKELAKDDLSMSDTKTYIQSLDNATERLVGIVDLIAGIKSIKDRTGYSFEATSIRDVVEKSLAKYREEINKKNLRFQVPTFKDIPMLTVDLKKITFVIDTIIENAIYYSPKDATVVVDCLSKKRKLVLAVADSGIGLSFQDKFKIFSKFFRSKNAVLNYPDGMGLRLYLSKQIVDRHHGKLFAKSEGRNKGTTFFLILPH